MIRLLARIVLTAMLFCFVFPIVGGTSIVFHGQFWPDGLFYAAVFAVVAYVVDILIGLAIAGFTLATLGLGLLLVVPAMLFGFWLVPAIELQVFAHFFPHQFTVSGWIPAIWAGLLLMAVNYVTRSHRHGSAKSAEKPDSDR